MRIQIPHARQPRIEMIPLLDTFFLILAFFISSVITMEVVQGLPVELPHAHGTRIPQEKRLLLTISKEGQLQMEGESVTLELLQKRLRGTPDPGSVRVGIRADRATPYEWVVQVLAAVRQAGVSRVSLLTESPGKREGFSK